MAKRKKEPEKAENAERWLLTYADLITLLMIFFIIMYSLSVVDAKKFQQVATSLSQVLAGQSPSILDTAGSSMMNAQGPSMAQGQSGTQVPDPPGKGNGENAMKQVEQDVKKIKEKLGPGVSVKIVVTEQERGLVISIKDTLLFASGSAELSPEARNLVRMIGSTLADVKNYVRVEGHTDNRPIHTAQFPSNWELSVMRATSVAHVLCEDSKIAPDRISATGYGEYRPLVPNDTSADRQINRRVDIVILKYKYDYFEPPKPSTTGFTATSPAGSGQ
ncbi:MAG: flagellar motor protein MotB [Solirubrobacterales bacterium]